MTNQEYIKQLDTKSLAELLVKEIQINEGDEGMDGEWCDFYITYYTSPDGTQHYDLEDAVEYTIRWLNVERIDNEQ